MVSTRHEITFMMLTEDGVVTTYDYSGLNQLEKADTTVAEIEYTYDERGNQVLENIVK